MKYSGGKLVKLFGSVSRILLFCLPGAMALADSKLNTPFFTSNMNPLINVYSLPATRDGIITAKNQLQMGLQFEAANSFSYEDHKREAIFLDGESYRTTLAIDYGVNDRLELGLVLPYIRHGSGELDSLIEQWHSFWSMPNGNRGAFPRDRLTYSYRRDGREQAQLIDSASGLGDIDLTFGWQLSDARGTAWALRGGVTLPTGDADKLTGSESTGVYLGLHASEHGLFAMESLYAHGSFGLLWLGEGEVVEAARKDWVSYGSAGLGWMMNNRISLKLQLDFHSALYDSALTEIGEFTAVAVFGGSIYASNNTVFDIAVSEDILVGASPDIVFQLGVRSVF